MLSMKMQIGYLRKISMLESAGFCSLCVMVIAACQKRRIRNSIFIWQYLDKALAGIPQPLSLNGILVCLKRRAIDKLDKRNSASKWCLKVSVEFVLKHDCSKLHIDVRTGNIENDQHPFIHMSCFGPLRCVRLKQLDDLQLVSFRHLQNLLLFIWRLVDVFCKRLDLSIQTTDPIGIWPAYLKTACWPTVKILDVSVCML